MNGSERAERSLLLVAQLAPPSSLVAARRVAGMAKYLPRSGYSVTVLTSLASGRGGVEGAEAVVRTSDALTSRVNWRRGQFAALVGSSERSYRSPSRLASLLVPDLSAATWLPFALPRALRLARSWRFDCVITSSPPPSAHLIGLALRRRGLRWVAEFRDGWTFEPPRAPWPMQAQRELDRRLERLIVEHGDAVVGVTRPIVDDLRERFGVNARLITNGYDPDEAPSAPLEADQLLAADRHSLVHTGRMSLSGITPRPLLDAIRVLKHEQPEIAGRLEVVFAGSVTAEERNLLTAPDLEGIVRVAGWVERPRALRLQRAADTLLVLTEGSARRSVATGKLFEYLMAGRPILVLGDDTEAARIVADTGTGTATSADDPWAIAAALRRAVDGEPPPSRNPEEVSRYSWDALAVEYAAILDAVQDA